LHGRVHIQVGTLSKAIGVLGGYVAGPSALRDYLIHRARPFLSSTSHPPAVTAACSAAIDVLLDEPEWVDRVWANTRLFRTGLLHVGCATGTGDPPIPPVMVGDDALTRTVSDTLLEEGVYAQGIVYPTVPKGKARVRTIVTAGHSRQELEKALEAFGRAGQKLGLI